jgi:ABC-type oligopeptide transport system substrate-binding subunit
MALRIKNDLQRLGFRIDAEPLSPEVVRTRMKEGDYTLVLSEMTLYPTPDAIGQIFHSSNIENNLNFTRYSSSTFNSLIDGFFRRDQSESRLDSYFQSAVRLLGEEYPLIPLFFQANEWYVFNNSVLDPDFIAMPQRRLNPIAEWKWR